MSNWLRPDEAAVWLRVSRANVLVLAHRDKWRKVRDGRRVLYWAGDVEATCQARAEVRAEVR